MILYTTQELIDKINLDKDSTIEQKEAEAKKTILSNDAFAICDFITQLKYEISKVGFR